MQILKLISPIQQDRLEASPKYPGSLPLPLPAPPVLIAWRGFHMGVRAQLKSSCLCGNHFIHRAISSLTALIHPSAFLSPSSSSYPFLHPRPPLLFLPSSVIFSSPCFRLEYLKQTSDIVLSTCKYQCTATSKQIR